MDHTTILHLPPEIEKRTWGLPYTENRVGMSGAVVRMYEDAVLKIQPTAPWTEREGTMLRWLHGKVPAPELIEYAEREGRTFLLMTRVRGRMACDPYFLDRPALLTERLAQAMRMLWDADISDCPVRRDQETELAEARIRVERGMVDLNNVEPATFGPGGFRDPEALLLWLERNRPSYEPVLSHGDFCLPNIFLTKTGVSGFIDLGDSGVGDRWRDIAICRRSLRDNLNGRYASKSRPEYSDRLFDALDIRPDPEKLRWYLLLDELF